MPKVSDAHRERRREEILEGAQRVFARHGYEGATVARLEDEIGLSRGAIFNYFESKSALFVTLARRSSDRFVGIWLEHGYRALLDAIAEADADWLAVQVEAVRRIRTDAAFPAEFARVEQEVAEGRAERYRRLGATVRDDVPIGVVADFLGMVANGVAFARVTGDPLPDLDQLMALVEGGVAPR